MLSPMLPSGHLRPDSSLVATKTQDGTPFLFPVSRRLASPGSDSSLSLFFCSSPVLYGILFFFLRTGHLRSSDNACFSFPYPDHRPSLYQISVRSRSTSDGPLRSSPRLKLFSSPRSTESEEAFRRSSTRYWFDIDQPQPCLLLSAPNFRLRAPELATVMAGPALATRAAPNLP